MNLKEFNEIHIGLVIIVIIGSLNSINFLILLD